MSWKKWKNTVTGSLAGAGVGFMTGGPVGALIGAGVGGFAGYSTDAQNQANKKAVNAANAYDLYTWDLANQYNDPSAQMKRLKAAGLNPNLVYGSGNVTGNTSGVAHSNGVASQEVFNAQQGLQLAQGMANLRNTNTQNELLKYQQGQTQAQTAQIQAQTAHTEAETRNLNNYLNKSGRSTYDPTLQKTIESGMDKVSSVGKGVADATNSYWQSLGDVWYRGIKNFKEGYSFLKGVYNGWQSR